MMWRMRPGTAGEQVISPNTVVSTVASNVTSFDISGRVPGITYCYAVSAFNTRGESIASGPACATAGSASNAPTAPTNLVLTPVAGGNATRLDWIDTSTNEEGFRILRGGQVVTTVGPNVTTFTDGGIVPGAGCYQVVAFNSAGEAPSNLACPGGTAAPSAPTNLRLSAVAGGNATRLDWTDNANNEE